MAFSYQLHHDLLNWFWFIFIDSLKKNMSEILILGCGRDIQPVNPELRRFIRSTGMKLEAVDSVYIYYIIASIYTTHALHIDIVHFFVW